MKLLMRKFFQLHDVGIKELLIFGLILLAGYTIWIHKTFVSGAYEKVTEVIDRVPGVHVLDRCGADCQEKIDRKVAEALATVSAKQNTTTVGGGVFATTYIPIGSTFSTRNLDWTDIPGQAEVDSEGYGTGPSFYWEVSVKIGNSNGEVFVRLFDITNSIAVSNSELSVKSASYTNVSSAALPFWRGKNLYKIQIKSTSGEEAIFASGRIKVIYR